MKTIKFGRNLLILFIIHFAVDAQQIPPDQQPVLNTIQDSQPQNVPDGFIYDPTGKRDPFELETDLPKNDSSTIVQAPVDDKPQRALEPLEYFDLSQLKVTAIIWNTKNPRAMVRDPNGTMHSVKIKSRIGQRNGFVTAIREGEIVVVEYTQQQGQWSKTFNVLYLR